MTKEDLDFIGSMNMCDEISNEAYKKIVCHFEGQEPCDDCISRQAVECKLKAIVNEMETIFADIRERKVDDSVCGLCEYDCDHGIDGYANECPGFERDDCFKLKDEYRKEWESINELPSVTPQKPNIKALGDELRSVRKSIKGDRTLVGYNIALGICNKYLTEQEPKTEQEIREQINRLSTYGVPNTDTGI